jgi:hypothetical protein
MLVDGPYWRPSLRGASGVMTVHRRTHGDHGEKLCFHDRVQNDAPVFAENIVLVRACSIGVAGFGID